MLNQNQKDIISMREPVMLKPTVSKPDIIAVKKKITLPPIDLDKINNPSYVSYYQIVREKIRRTAYQNYTRTEQGEVFLSFVISSDGYIKEIRVVEDKSSSNPYLLETSVKSIKGAAPFPNFPKELDYQQLSFNVVISYEVGD
ncbi:MAG: energy transducer TonB [Candidatus Omnitrophica bacterium]|nr:energy transducer TonB [Candidatus Omnitrophota bacterium]